MVHFRDLLHRRVQRRQSSWWTWSTDDGFRSSDDNSASVDGTSTVVQVVYVTQEASFTGPTASLLTQTGDASPTRSISSVPQNTPATTTRQAPSTASNTSVNNSNKSSSSVTQSNASHSSTNSATRNASTTANKQTSQTSAAVSAAPTSTTEPAATGMSTGAKAGIAFGIIMVLALIAGIAFLILRKKKQQKKEAAFRADSEKSDFTSSRAPRLSLRPVTQFLPSIGDHKVAEMTSSTGAVLSTFPAPAQDSRPGSNASNNPSNPFGRTAETVEPSAMSEKIATSEATQVPAMMARPSIPTAAANPFADIQPNSRAASPEHPKLENPQVSPVRAEFDDAPAPVPVPAASTVSPIVPVLLPTAQAAPPSPTHSVGHSSNVHRVQLDFKPSMDDELELRAGQVVRIVHEYDDGWALCSYMDRSRQGVVPRSCLSKFALKPRPNGTPPQQHQQGMQPLRPASPGYRNFSTGPAMGPNGSRNPMYPAPLSPSLPNINQHPRGGVDMLPSGRPRSQSQSQLIKGQRQSPQMLPSAGFGASPPRDHRRSASAGGLMNLNSSHSGVAPIMGGIRKPVFGQAM